VSDAGLSMLLIGVAVLLTTVLRAMVECW